MDSFSKEDDEALVHSPEPWKQEGRYIRDASGAIVVRGKTLADARRIVAAVNATRDIPTEALENWLVQDVSDPRKRPDLEVDLVGEPAPSPYAVIPPERRNEERRRKERRAAFAAADPPPLVFDRRVMERRLGKRRKS
ncbi:MAG TPA: hypothetical protein VGL03_01930 [Thermoanaerobaculia bacterium]